MASELYLYLFCFCELCRDEWLHCTYNWVWAWIHFYAPILVKYKLKKSLNIHLYKKHSQTKVWAHIKKLRMLLNQRFLLFCMNIIYIKCTNKWCINIYMILVCRLVCIKSCIFLRFLRFLSIVNPHFSGVPLNWIRIKQFYNL